MAIRGDGKIAVITGASSGIGEATAQALAQAGFTLALGARRREKLDAVADSILKTTGSRPYTANVDVTDSLSCKTFVAGVLDTFGKVNVLVNNAGLASGTTYIENAVDDEEWQTMLDTNVSGLLRMTRLLLPHIIASGEGHVVNLGSTAGHDAYAGGSVYCGTKFAVRAITDALRQELLGKPVRVTSVDPGMVETEFSIVRYHGSADQAKQVYSGMTPLTADDIADCILFAVTRNPHVNIDTMIVKPTDQARAGMVARK